MDEYMTLREASSLWGISERRIRTLCADGRIDGVTRFGRSWAIPIYSKKPQDMRVKSGKYIKNMDVSS